MTVKLLWHPGPVHYRLDVFMGPAANRRAFAGELTFTPVEAAWFRLWVIAPALELMGDALAERGWLQPVAV